MYMTEKKRPITVGRDVEFVSLSTPQSGLLENKLAVVTLDNNGHSDPLVLMT